MTDHEEYDNPDRRIHWQLFIATLVGMALVAAAVVVLLGNIKDSHSEDQITRRAKYEACKSIENEASLIVCLNGWQ